MGLHGQAVGTITTNPEEVDAISRRAWQAIYGGSASSIKSTVDAFMKKYDKYIFKAAPVQLDEISMELVR